MISFNIGDEVEVINEDNRDELNGVRGKVKCFNNEGFYIGIEFKKEYDFMNSLSGACEDGYGYFIHKEHLKLIKAKGKTKTENDLSFKPGMKIDKYVKMIIKSEPSNSTRRKWLNTFSQCVLPEKVKTLIEEALIVMLRSEKFEEWEINKHFEKGLTNSILLYGESRTGKTMIAESISAVLNKNIMKLDSGAIQSNIPGQIERNIKESFEKAEKEDAVLLLDECDSLLYNRESVGAIMSSEINSLLTEIERFKGVCILTTNRLNRLDSALQRRIIAKIELPLPTEKARVQIWKNLIPKKMPLNENVDYKILAQYDLSGGEIKNAILLTARKVIAQNKDNCEFNDFKTAIEGIMQSKKDFNECHNYAHVEMC